MEESELRRLGRRELQDALLEREEEIERLRGKLVDLERKLADREILIDQAGSIAEAALSVNGVFQSAEKAAAQYLENIERLNSRQEDICQKMEQEAREKAERIVADAQKRADTILETARRESGTVAAEAQELSAVTQKRCEQMEADAKQKADEYWQAVTQRVEQFCQSREELKALLSGAAGQRGETGRKF